MIKLPQGPRDVRPVEVNPASTSVKHSAPPEAPEKNQAVGVKHNRDNYEAPTVQRAMAQGQKAQLDELAGRLGALGINAAICRQGNELQVTVSGPHAHEQERAVRYFAKELGLTIKNVGQLAQTDPNVVPSLSNFVGPGGALATAQRPFDPKFVADMPEPPVVRGSVSVISGKVAKASKEAVRFSAPGGSGGVRG